MKKYLTIYCQLIFIISVSWNAYSQNNNVEFKDSKITLVVTSTANQENLVALKTYVNKVMPMLFKINGDVVKRSKIIDVINGKKEFEFLLIMDFPSKEKLLKLFNSSEYKALLPNRNKGFITINMLFANDIK